MVDLLSFFHEINQKHFNESLSVPLLAWNGRLKTTAGRFIPGSRVFFNRTLCKIEVASYLLSEEKARYLIYDTLAHEMIHFWLWLRRKPYGHTPEFLSKMREMGVSRYNPVPKQQPFRYLYQCSHCLKEFPVRRKLHRSLACAECCKTHSYGKYDSRFKLSFVK